ncbi:DUF5388 domain-containing protein [Lysinibacillus sp. BW-2-10]|uniref:DUF5388 domain-containing protein n=1 Tax=Lysinibacillus sp. BW-2-10 TaxID=2590030 RepID=UPI001642390E|nr:DUF5388 domain-containing protein [Lysinibacillus sp. BW-2-10]
MSNLLNNQTKKKLLDRGPKITPTQEFTLTDIEEKKVEPKGTTPPAKAKEKEKDTEKETVQVQKRTTPQNITSVRVSKATRNKLNALVQLGKAESVDVLIDILLDEYVERNIGKTERKTYDIIVNVLQKKDR